MTMKINKEAWAILRKEESSSLVLSKVQEKSSWQAGEILNRSHYKYLEIKQRAEKFFEMFTLHYNTYGKLIPEGLEINEYFEKYLHLAIEKRQVVKTLVGEIDNKYFSKAKTREPIIERCILDLRNSKSIHAQNLYTIIMDFDRFNNFRILPKSVQEPSAFKRRNKTRFRKHLIISTSLQPYVLMRIKELYECDTKSLKLENEGYAVVALFPHSNDIIRLNANQDTLLAFSRISIYVFKYKEQAKEYLDLVFDYLDDDRRNPKAGLLFWPKFRNMIKLSLNYEAVNNISPTRKGLYTALRDMDISYKTRRNADKNRASLNSYE